MNFRLIRNFCLFEESYVLPFENLSKARTLLLLIIIFSLCNSRFVTNEAELIELSNYVCKVALLEHSVDESWQLSNGILFNFFAEYMT